MTGKHVRFAIIGGGLAGLCAANLLERQGIRDYVLLEAREEFGGRVQTFHHDGPPSTGGRSKVWRFDMGPTWFWPELQPELDQVVRELGVERFAQFEAGDMMIERSPTHAVRVQGLRRFSDLGSGRWGMKTLVEALVARLANEKLLSGQCVRSLRLEGSVVVVEGVDNSEAPWRFTAEQVLLAVPPRLAQASIDFLPNLPVPLAEQWKRTATWMAPHAKYLAVYDTPFWRDVGLSGEARSSVGPLGEIHDATTPRGGAALFGFFAVPASVRAGVSDEVMRGHCRAQLVRLFGPRAASPIAECIKDWATDLLTATPADLAMSSGHATPPAATAADGAWHGRVVGVASEWSQQFPGYVAGALEAARLGVQAVTGDSRSCTLKGAKG